MNVVPQDSLYTVYNAILSDHLDAPGNKFPFLVRKMCSCVVNATLQLHAKVSQVIKIIYLYLASGVGKSSVRKSIER